MALRQLKRILPAFSDPIGDLQTVRPLPSPQIDVLDPFLFLNHHGPQIYAKKNQGLPFGPHPHRGFQTVTFIVEGDIAHKDSAGHESVIERGGAQWMSAGKGLIHEEVSSDNFKLHGGPLEILQLWVNLPAKDKFSVPYYKGLQQQEIPHIKSDDGQVQVQVIAGLFAAQAGAFQPSTDLTVLMLHMKGDGVIQLQIPGLRQIFFYVVRGSLQVNGVTVNKMNLVEFTTAGQQINVSATTDSLVLVCHAVPYNEPIVSSGPFVMNTTEEIRQAYADYQAGRF